MNYTNSPPVPLQSEKEFIFLTAFLMSIVAISIDALLPALNYIARDLAVSKPNHIQYLIGFIFIGMSIGQLISGPISDALGRKKILYAGIAIYMVGNAICFFSQTLECMLLGRFVQGLGVSGPYVSAVSIVRDKYSGSSMAKMMSLIMMIFIMVPAIAPSLGQAILFLGNWRWIFLMYMGYALLITGWIAFHFEETLPLEHRIPFSIKSIISGFYEVTCNKATMSYTVCMGICFGSFIGYLNSSQQIFQNQFGVGKLFTVYFGGLALILGVASLMNSRFVEKLGMNYVCVRSFVAITASSAIFFALNVTTTIDLWMFVIYAAILFFSIGLIFGNLNSMAMEPMGHIAGIASAIIGSVSSVISMVLGGFIGQLYNNTLIPITCGFLIFGSLSLALLSYASKQKSLT